MFIPKVTIRRPAHSRSRPAGSVAHANNTGIDGTNTGGYVPSPPKTWSPLEAHPQWSNIEGVPVDSNTSYTQTGVVTVLGSTTPPQGIAFTLTEIFNGGIFFDCHFVGADATTNAFYIGCIRMQDAENFIGISAADNRLKLWEKVGGVSSWLGEWAPDFSITNRVTLLAEKQFAILTAGGKQLGEVPVTIADPGRVGIVAGAWTGPTPKIISSGYNIRNNDGEVGPV